LVDEKSRYKESDIFKSFYASEFLKKFGFAIFYSLNFEL